MKESIPARVGRIISSSLNAMVDALENVAPEMVMQEAVREIEAALDDVRTQLGRALSQNHLATQRLAAQRKQHATLEEQAKLAVRENRDDLAEAAIARQMDIEMQIPILEQAVRDAEKQTKELEGYINALKAKRREMREEIQRIATAKNIPTNAGESPAHASDAERRVAAASSAFERVMENSSGVVGAQSEVNAKLAELEELARTNRIAERLAAIKAGGE